MAKNTPAPSPEELALARAPYVGFLQTVELQQDYLRTIIPDQQKTHSCHYPISHIGQLNYYLRALSQGENLSLEARKNYLALVERLCLVRQLRTYAPDPIINGLGRDLLAFELEHSDVTDPAGVSFNSEGALASVISLSCESAGLGLSVSTDKIRALPVKCFPISSSVRDGLMPVVVYLDNLRETAQINEPEYYQILDQLLRLASKPDKFATSLASVLANHVNKPLAARIVNRIIARDPQARETLFQEIFKVVELKDGDLVRKADSAAAYYLIDLFRNCEAFATALQQYVMQKQTSADTEKVGFEAGLIAQMQAPRPVTLKKELLTTIFTKAFDPHHFHHTNVSDWPCIEMGYSQPAGLASLESLPLYFTRELETKFPGSLPGAAFTEAIATLQSACAVRRAKLEAEIGAFIDSNHDLLWASIEPFYNLKTAKRDQILSGRPENRLIESKARCAKICAIASASTSAFFDEKFAELIDRARQRRLALEDASAHERELISEKGPRTIEQLKLDETLAAYGLSDAVPKPPRLGKNPRARKEIEVKSKYLTDLLQALAIPDKSFGINNEVETDGSMIGEIKYPNMGARTEIAYATSSGGGSGMGIEMVLQQELRIAITSEVGSTDSLLILYLHESSENNEHRRKMVDCITAHEVSHWIEWQWRKRQPALLPQLEGDLAQNEIIPDRLREIALDGIGFGMVQKYGTTKRVAQRSANNQAPGASAEGREEGTVSLEETPSQRLATYADSFAHSGHVLTILLQERAQRGGAVAVENVLDLQRFCVQGELLLERLEPDTPLFADVMASVEVMRREIAVFGFETDPRFSALCREWFLHGEQFAMNQLGPALRSEEEMNQDFLAKTKAAEKELFPELLAEPDAKLPSWYLENGLIKPREIYKSLIDHESRWVLIGDDALPLAQFLRSLGVSHDQITIFCTNEEHAPFEIKYMIGPTRKSDIKAIRGNYSKVVVLPGALAVRSSLPGQTFVLK